MSMHLEQCIGIPVAGGSVVQVRAGEADEDDENATARGRRDDRARRGGDLIGDE